ncbi:MAG: hypothetical protein ACI81P_002020 [Neolewinella sp.]|jgi:hypothetical protein
MNEKSNKLISLLASLDRAQRRGCRKLIQSPFFSANEDLLLFFEEITKRLDRGKALNKQEIWQAVLGKIKPYNDTRFRKYTSDLFKLIKEFLMQETLQQEPELRRYLYFSALEKQRSEKLIKGIERNWDDLIAVSSSDDALRYLYLHLLEFKKHSLLNFEQRRNERSNVEEISRALDIYFIISKLKDAVNAESRGHFEKQNYSLLLAEEVVNLLDDKKVYLEEPLVTIYYYMYKMITLTDADEFYYQYRSIILGQDKQLSIPPSYAYIPPALNYCVVKITKGNREFMNEYLDVYKFALQHNVAFENDSIDPGAFKNTVQIAMQLGEYDWAENYVKTYQDKLNDSDRANTVNYNLAMIYFYQKKFSIAQDYLREVEYQNTTLNLNTKMMLLAIYYELDEDMVLDSFFDSTIAYLNRHKELTDKGDKHYRNLVLYTRRLTRLLPGDATGITKLKGDLSKEQYVASKSWLEEKIREFTGD